MQKRLLYIAMLFLMLIFGRTWAMNLRLEIDLAGEWLFEIGDNPAYLSPDFEDGDWELIRVPNFWENEGFPGYDGYAWYRLRFFLPLQLRDRVLYLKLGRIDDVDRTYFNGHFIGGQGSFPPKYQTAYDVKRIYRLDPEILKFGEENVVAVQVFDYHLGGGIAEGKVGIFSRHDVLALDIDLGGQWKFSTGDDPMWARPDWDDTGWATISVPNSWENEGFENYDGFAWYRKTLRIGSGLARSKLILMLGYIDDIDEVYFNGVLIGHTGRFPSHKDDWMIRGFNDLERAYFIPPHLIRSGGENVIAVRVYDRGGLGGIVRGYVGITTRDNYLRYMKNKRE
ncbi:MAG TPA: glycoside hydrolase [bacterium]|nr:glycoside hydrolase [bacterium]